MIPINFCFNNITKKSFLGTPRGRCPTPGCQEALDLAQMVIDIHEHPETTTTNLFYHTKQLLFQQHYQKVISWDTPGSMPFIWVSEALDLTQMVMDIQKQLKTTIIIIPNNLCFNNITKKSFPATPRGSMSYS